ncbi:hypothetical protein Tco_0846411, partial [Tanacetum coccineum]
MRSNITLVVNLSLSIKFARFLHNIVKYKILDIDVKVGRLPGDLHNVVKRREYKLVIRGMKYD